MNIQKITKNLINVISKDVLEYVIIRYVNTLKHISYYGRIPSKETFIKLALPLLPNIKYEYEPLYLHYNEFGINARVFDDVHCCVKFIHSYVYCIVIIYNYLQKKIISYTTHSSDIIIRHINNDNYIIQTINYEYIQYNIYTHTKIREYSFRNFTISPEQLPITFFKNLIFCEMNDIFLNPCDECTMYGSKDCHRKLSSDAHKYWLIIEINNGHIRRINCNIPENFNGFNFTSEKYLSFTDHNILRHHHIDSKKTIVYKLNKINPKNTPIQYYVHNNIFYRFCAEKRIKVYELKTKVIKYLYTINFNHKNGIKFDGELIGNGYFSNNGMKIYRINNKVWKY